MAHPRPVNLQTPIAGEFLVWRLEGVEELARLRHCTLDVATTARFTFDQLLGQKVRLDFPMGKHQHFQHGLVKHLALEGHDDYYTHYRLEIVPPVWLLTQQVHSRVFTKKSIPQIVLELLKGHQVKNLLQHHYHARDHVAQYQESDFHFLSRLLEEEGIYYYFDDTESDHQLVLADDSTHSPHLPYLDTVHYTRVQREGGHEHPLIDEWKLAQGISPGSIRVWDHCFLLHDAQLKKNYYPPQKLEAKEQMARSVKAGELNLKLRGVGDNSNFEVFHHLLGYGHRYDAVDEAGHDKPEDLQQIFADNERAAQLLMQEAAAASVQVKGAGNCLHFSPGHAFTLDHHPQGNGKYLLTRVERTVEAPLPHRNGEDKWEARVEFHGLPHDLPFRPARRTPRPRIHGAQTAMVVGAGETPITCATYARVKVQFHWDQAGQHDGSTSRWVRVAQPFAGSGYGQVNIPRVGHEVVVIFLDGDPDQPLIVGSVYNFANPPSHSLPDLGHFLVNKTHALDGSGYCGSVTSDQSSTLVTHVGNQRLDSTLGDHNSVIGGTYNQVSSNRVRFTGGLPLGSGAGGGDSSSSESETDQWENFGWHQTSGKVDGTGYELGFTLGVETSAILGLKVEAAYGYVMEIFVDPLAFLTAGPLGVPGLGSILGILPIPHVAKTEFYAGNRTDYYCWGYKVTCNSDGERKLDLSHATGTVLILKKVGKVLGYAFAVLSLADFVLYASEASKIGSSKGWRDALEGMAISSLIILGAADLIPFFICWYEDYQKTQKEAQATRDKATADLELQAYWLEKVIADTASIIASIAGAKNPQQHTVQSKGVLLLQGRNCNQLSDETTYICAGKTEATMASMMLIGSATASIDVSSTVTTPMPVAPGIYMDVGAAGPGLRMLQMPPAVYLGIGPPLDFTGELARVNLSGAGAQIFAAGNSEAGLGLALMNLPVPSATLIAGTAEGPFVKLGATGITIQFLPGVSITLGETGITLTAGAASISMLAEGGTITVSGLTASLLGP
ncbi:MAG: type VI secretion system Vgr family protein [Gemmataceae bacterium]